ncbi:MFS transporter [Streptacidiphilus sp. EB129]|uniref:MFS transporter n=1 Tax=Streptacidiphilus sp. EB129 TaxID=3156262 RepID=UPI003511E9FC
MARQLNDPQVTGQTATAGRAASTAVPALAAAGPGHTGRADHVDQAPGPGHSDRAAGIDRAGWRLLALAAGFVMAAVDATVVNVAGESLRQRLGLGLSQLTWVVDGYTLTFAALLLLAGSLADRFGARRLYLAGMTVFGLASLACALAPDGSALVGARLVQGAGAALFMPSSLTLLTASFPDPQRRARMVALWSAIVSGSMALGPAIGGVLVQTLGWRSIFLLNLPIGVFGLVLAARVVPSLPGRPARFAWAGHLLGAGMLALLCFTLIQGSVLGWGSAPILGSISGTVILGALFVRHLRHAERPVLPAALFRSRAFAAANAVGFLINCGVYGGTYLLGLFLQVAEGADALTAGLEMLPATGVFVLGNLLFARMVRRTGVRRPLIAGTSLAGVVMLSLVTVSPAMPYGVLAALLAVGNLGIGVAVPAMMAALVEAVGPVNANSGAATMNANRQVGTLVGVALTGIVLAATGGHWYTAAAVTFGICGAGYLTAALLAWRHVRPGDQI